jgi:hypothetical protein
LENPITPLLFFHAMPVMIVSMTGRTVVAWLSCWFMCIRIQELETVLGSESEMEMLYLGRRIASQEPAQQPAQLSDDKQQSLPRQQEGGAPAGPRRSSQPLHAASAPPVAEHEDSEDDAEGLPTAAGEAREPQRRHSAEVCAVGSFPHIPL